MIERTTTPEGLASREHFVPSPIAPFRTVYRSVMIKYRLDLVEEHISVVIEEAMFVFHGVPERGLQKPVKGMDPIPILTSFLTCD